VLIIGVGITKFSNDIYRSWPVSLLFSSQRSMAQPSLRPGPPASGKLHYLLHPQRFVNLFFSSRLSLRRKPRQPTPSTPPCQ